MAMDMMTDKDGDGIPDGAEITKRTTGTDGSVTTAKWVKGQMSMTNAAGDQITRGSVSPAAGSFDNTSMVRTNQPTFAQARLAEFGYTDANAPDHLMPGRGGSNMRIMTPREQLGGGPLLMSERAEARRMANKQPTLRDIQQQIITGHQRMKMMEIEGANRRAEIDANARILAAELGRPLPEPERPIMGAAGVLIPRPGSGWDIHWRPEAPPSNIVPPGSPGRMIPDPTDPTGQRFDPFKPQREIQPVEKRNAAGQLEYIVMGDQIYFPRQGGSDDGIQRIQPGAVLGGAPGTQQPPTGEQPKPMSDSDRMALEWANANPNDPRSEAIRKRLGVK